VEEGEEMMETVAALLMFRNSFVGASVFAMGSSRGFGSRNEARLSERIGNVLAFTLLHIWPLTR